MKVVRNKYCGPSTKVLKTNKHKLFAKALEAKTRKERRLLGHVDRMRARNLKVNLRDVEDTQPLPIWGERARLMERDLGEVYLKRCSFIWGQELKETFRFSVH